MNTFNMNKLRIVCFVLLILLPVCAFAVDWGLYTDHDLSLEGTGASLDTLNYSAYLVPWFSAPLFGGDGDLYLSAGIAAKYENEKWKAVPELFQTDLTYRFNIGEIRAGRMRYTDPLGFVASGLFDGLALSLDTWIGSFNAGVWYTGFQYKGTANITVTQEDLDSYNEEFTYDNFLGTYFSSRRILAAVGWEHSGLGELVRLKVSLLNQADVNGREAWYHSQYLVARASVPIQQLFVVDLGGSVSLAETVEGLDTGLAGELDFAFFLPTVLQDKLSFKGIFSSGNAGSIAPFIPLSTVSQGNILKAKLSGLSVMTLDYTVRLHRTFSAIISSTYFVLSDLGTYQGWPVERAGHFLGNEFYGLLIWAPFSDLRLNLGGGLFVPAMGNADPEAPPRWQVELGVQLAIF